VASSVSSGSERQVTYANPASSMAAMIGSADVACMNGSAERVEVV
jgi:hypothetical protein